jgi:hypothetical protein
MKLQLTPTIFAFKSIENPFSIPKDMWYKLGPSLPQNFVQFGSTATVLRSYGGLKYTGGFLEDRPLPGFLSVAIYVQLVIEKSVLLRSSSWTSLETSLLLKFWAYVLTKSMPRITRLQKLQPPSWLGTLPPSSRQCSWECNYSVAAGEITVV